MTRSLLGIADLAFASKEHADGPTVGFGGFASGSTPWHSSETARAALWRRSGAFPWIEHKLCVTDFLLDCRVVRKHLSDAHDGVLRPVERALLRAHLATCPECAPVERSLHSTLSLLRQLRDEREGP